MMALQWRYIGESALFFYESIRNFKVQKGTEVHLTASSNINQTRLLTHFITCIMLTFNP